MKSVFYVCPIGNEDSPQRRRSDIVLKHIIEPVCNDLDFQVTRVDKLNSVDRIDNTILEHLNNSDLVIADMSEHNPNAFYEMGYRQALGKPLIPIIEEETKIPFDVANLRTISYVTNDLEKADAAKHRLRETILSFNIQDNGENNLSEQSKTEQAQLNVLPYLLNIQDSLGEIKSLVMERNNELAAQTIDLAMNQIQKNSINPEAKFMELLLSQAIQSPENFKQIVQMAEQFPIKEFK
jgi:nucleoside 2-deoxyribosyltransferase